MTKRLLREALIELLKDKPVERINTTELCAAADINRNTFYAHYSAPEDVLQELEDEVIEECDALMKEHEPKDAQLALIRYAYEHRDVSRALLASPSVRIVQRVRELCRSLNDQEWERHSPGSAEAAMAFFAYSSAGSLTIVSHWLEAGCPASPETINDFLWRMALYGASGFNKDEV